MINLIQANGNDSDIIKNIIISQARYLNSRNIDYWRNWIQPESMELDNLLHDIRSGRFFLIYSDKELIGCCAIQNKDEYIWGPCDDSSIYLHKIAKLRSYKKAFVLTIIDVITNYAKKLNAKFIRLDCGAECLNLCTLYESVGFKKIQQKRIDGYELALYEKNVG